MVSKTDIYCHGGHPRKKHIKLRAGNLSLSYEEGNIRYISAGNSEILRMIYCAVRDSEWLTIKPVISNEEFEILSDSFKINCKCRYSSGEIDFGADFNIEGRPDNSLIFTFKGEALSTFEKNRIGFCVLHPIESYAGRSCVIEHHDGSSEQSFFPEEISPHQVFMDIRSMRWLVNGIRFTIDFEGDIFETEDQRNWADASFKTYSTPLSVPFPVTLEKGTRINQRIAFQAEGSFDIAPATFDKTVIKLFPEETLKLPSIGICQSTRRGSLTKKEIKELRTLSFNHYRVDLYLFEDNWRAKAVQAYHESSDIGCSIEFALFFDDNSHEQIKSFISWYSEKKPHASAILLFHKSQPSTPDQLALQILPLLREAVPVIKTGTGTNANFAQINRIRPGDTGNDFICYSIHPQEHASDNTTLVENLKAQEYTVRSARKFAGDKGIKISPVTIQKRFNANNTYLELPWPGPELPPQVDSRLMSLFGACWTAGSIKYLCESDIDSVTYYETVGERGIIQGEKESQWPSGFPADKGMILQVYFV